MFRALTVGDVHLMDKSPLNRLDDYTNTVFNKLIQISKLAKKLDVDAVFLTGDVFDKKSPKQNTHSLVLRAISVFKSFPCPVYSIIGNHDVAYSKPEMIAQQPLGVLFMSDAIKRLSSVMIKDVLIEGVDYGREPVLEPNPFPIPLKRIVVLHVYSSLTGGDIFGEKLFSYPELSKIPADIFVLGHYHIDQGITEMDGKYFINIGSLTRGSLSDDNIKRQPKVGFIEVGNDGTVVTKEIDLEVSPSDEIFDLTRREETKEQNEQMEIFIEKLNSENIQMGEDDLSVSLKSMDLDRRVKDKVMEYMERHI